MKFKSKLLLKKKEYDNKCRITKLYSKLGQGHEKIKFK
jgi:hypothetical protein